ncbi:MAG: dihydrofolate reductase family protein [Candidatus Lutacidiplasmatales archaeon]
MTRRITANVYMTLDGRGEFPTYPGSDLPSGKPGEPDEFFRKMWTDRFSDVTTVVMGRRSFTGHRRVHSLKARKPNAPKFLFDYSRFLERVDKVCLSHRLKNLDWANSRVLKGDLTKIIAKLKAEKGGNIILEGGPRLIHEVLRLNLADDYWFLVMPVVFGRGPRYWDPMKTQTNLKLLSVSQMKYGELVLHYGAIREGTASKGK